MYKLILYLGALSITFTGGYLASQVDWRATLPTKSALASMQVAPPEHWRRITVGTVSFDVPSDMKTIASPGNEGIVQALVKNGPHDLYLYYAYGPRIPTDANPLPGMSRHLTINGHAGILDEWGPRSTGVIIRAGDDLSGMQLVVADVGDGTNKFELYCVSYDIARVKQVINTVIIQPIVK